MLMAVTASLIQFKPLQAPIILNVTSQQSELRFDFYNTVLILMLTHATFNNSVRMFLNS